MATKPLKTPIRLTYGQLPTAPLPGVVLRCPLCGGDYSASRGDYFVFPEDEEPECVNCGGTMLLMVRRTTTRYVRVHPARAERPANIRTR